MLTCVQAELLACLRSAVAGKQNRRVIYCTEYLGYLPFGLYHWFTVDQKDIDRSALPPAFSRADIIALEGAGLLCRVEQLINPDDELEGKTTYEVQPA